MARSSRSLRWLLAAAPVLALTTLLAAPPAAAGEEIDPIVVSGERTGPALWLLRRGESNVWILGALSPLPKDITWRSDEVERVIADAGTVLVGKPLEIGFARALWVFLAHHDLLVVPDGRRLRDVLPPELYRRFATQRDRYTGDRDKWERYRPILAAAFLEETALRAAGLSTRIDMADTVRSLARRHGVAVDEVSVTGVRDLLDVLKTVPAATEDKCLAAALSSIETGLPRMAQRAAAWSRGDIAGMQRLPDSDEDLACRAALMSDSGAADLYGRMRQAWVAAIIAHARAPGTTLAVVHFDMLLARGGLLDQLQSEGFALVRAP